MAMLKNPTLLQKILKDWFGLQERLELFPGLVWGCLHFWGHSYFWNLFCSWSHPHLLAKNSNQNIPLIPYIHFSYVFLPIFIIYCLRLIYDKVFAYSMHESCYINQTSVASNQIIFTTNLPSLWKLNILTESINNL